MVQAQRHLPAKAPPVPFDAREARRLYDARGSNCGPCALSAITGFPLERILDTLGDEFDRRRATTEIMMTDALDALGSEWTQINAQLPLYGLARIQWDGPWIAATDPYEKLRHSHWIGVCRDKKLISVFDYNAISVGGWIDMDEWNNHLRPWLLASCEPEATGAWWVSDAYEVHPPMALGK